MDIDVLREINKFKSSESYNNMVTSEKYFKNKSEILDRKFYYYPMNVKTLDPYRANNKIVNNFFRMIVEQKVSYCLSKDVVINNYVPLINVNDFIDELAEETCIKGIGWVQPYIDSIESLKIAIIPSEQIIPLFDKTIEQNIINIIRFYTIDKVLNIELWDNEKVVYYSVDEHNKLIIEKEQLHNWGKIPFVPLYNNRHQMTDLENIKGLIDSFEKCVSDYSNNFEDFQDVYYKLKNYAGSSQNPEDVANIIEFLKRHHMVLVSADGDFEAIQLEIPHVAREAYLKMIRELIFLNAQAVDMDVLRGSSLTNTAIEAAFANLDNKCNKFLKFTRKFIENLMYFDTKFKTTRGNPEIDLSKFEVVFNTITIINVKESIDNVKNSDGIISKETNISNHSFVSDVKKELQLIEKEKKDYLINTDLNINKNNTDSANL